MTMMNLVFVPLISESNNKSRISSSWANHLRTTGCHRSMVLTILLAVRHKRAHPALTPAGEGWYSIYLPGRDGRLSSPRCLITRGPGIEPMTAGSEVRRPNHCATETPIRNALDWVGPNVLMTHRKQPKLFRLYYRLILFQEVQCDTDLLLLFLLCHHGTRNDQWSDTCVYDTIR